jgi:hypothetical protein
MKELVRGLVVAEKSVPVHIIAGNQSRENSLMEMRDGQKVQYSIHSTQNSNYVCTNKHMYVCT